ncbi:MAG: nuclear transport factor 2 family protein [Cyclobacteriaceae bacterium]
MRLNASFLVILFFNVTFFIFPDHLIAQARQDLATQTLTKEISHMDSVLFYAFNTCDVNLSKSLFTKDLEFYHDTGGLTNYSQNVNSIVQRCNGETKVRRELVKGSLKVFPIKDFGAIEIGSHSFYYTESGQEEKLDGTFKFVHVWQFIDGNWRISRVISYDH